MPMRPPRTFLNCFSGAVTKSMLSPSVVNVIDPDSIRPGDETSRNVDMAVTLLPQPLSPTKPSVRPRSIDKETPSTAGSLPSDV